MEHRVQLLFAPYELVGKQPALRDVRDLTADQLDELLDHLLQVAPHMGPVLGTERGQFLVITLAVDAADPVDAGSQARDVALSAIREVLGWHMVLGHLEVDLVADGAPPRPAATPTIA